MAGTSFRMRWATVHERLIMLKWLKHWLGWDSGSSLFNFGDLRAKPPSRPLPTTTQRGPNNTGPKPPATQPAPAVRPQPKDRNPMDVLDNPQLTLDAPPEDGFDPYNTGAFNRSASWDKISRQRKP